MVNNNGGIIFEKWEGGAVPKKIYSLIPNWQLTRTKIQYLMGGGGGGGAIIGQLLEEVKYSDWGRGGGGTYAVLAQSGDVSVDIG